jgi:GntR family transcriptional regulator
MIMANASRTGASLSVVERTRDAVIEFIANGRFSAGDRLPAERELAESLKVSRTTLREALAQLDRSGYVIRRPGRGGGTFVSKPKVERDLTSLYGLPEHLRRLVLVV